MKILGATIIALLSLLALFSLANWPLLTTSSALSLVFVQVSGPLGLVLLCFTLALVGLLVLYVLSQRTRMLMESRRHNRELEAQRKLAESAEASRVRELRERMELGFGELQAAIEKSSERTATAEQVLRGAFDETANGLAAHLGEMEEKLDRALTGSTNQQA
jgi:uncharacterized integral membrane protein